MIANDRKFLRTFASRNYKICQNWNENDWFSHSAWFILDDRLWLEIALHSNWCIYLALCCVQLKFAFNDLMTRWKHDSPINIECEYNNDVTGQSYRHQLYLLAYKYFHQPINWVVLAWPSTAKLMERGQEILLKIHKIWNIVKAPNELGLAESGIGIGLLPKNRICNECHSVCLL